MRPATMVLLTQPTAADPLRSTPGQPPRTDFHGRDHLRCLLRGKLEIMGALPKPGKDLLRPAAVGTP
ncbi:MAG: hypothetical protein PVI71_05815 [Desulfobacterales bacterium]